MGDTGANVNILMAIAPAVIALTQIAKWCGLPKRWAPLAVLLFAAVICAVWAYSESVGNWQGLLYQYVAATLGATILALGLYGFVTDKRASKP